MLPFIAALAMAAPEAQTFVLKDGDRVLFYGDSITEQRLYTTYVETFVKARYPKLKVDFVACGVGGDTVWGGWTAASDERVRRDVKPENPTVVTIMLGMNDGGYVPFDPKIFAVFQEWYGKLLGWMGEAVPKARITLITSPPYDDWAHPNTAFKGYSDTVRRFGEHVQKLTGERKFGFVDVNARVTEFIQWALKKDAQRAATIAPDAIHPGPEGHLVIAAEILKNWGVDPVVSDVEIDVSAGKVLKAAKAKVTDLKGMAWSQEEDALPYPLGAEFGLSREFLDFHSQFNQQLLTVRGLEPGTYRLSIDGEKVTEASAETWAKGINLAALETPMLKQARQVMEFTKTRSDAHFMRWRQVDFTLKDFPSTPAASEALKKLEKEIAAKQTQSAQPQKHQFEIARL